MHLLFRSISAYSGPSLLLGVFRTKDLAEAAQREYLATVMHGGADPWGDQENPRSSDDDVIVLSDLDLIDCPKPSTEASAATIAHVFVVSAYSCGFGQICRGFRAIAGSKPAADARAAQIAAENANDNFFGGTRIDSIPLDRLATEPNGYENDAA